MANKKITRQIDTQFSKYLGSWWNGLGRTTRNWVVFGAGALTLFGVLRFGIPVINWLLTL